MYGVYCTSDGSLMMESDVLEAALYKKKSEPNFIFELWFPIEDFTDQMAFYRLKEIFDAMH